MGDSGNNSLLSVIFWNGPVLAMPLVSLVYPLYASIRSIETRCREDDQQWLTYWVLHSLISLFELTFYRALEWLPFWPLLKILAVCWLVLPFFNGAAYVYEVFVRPFYWNPVIRITYVPKMNRVFSRPDWLVPASERYREENRLGAYERMARVDREARARRSSHMMAYDHNYHYYGY